VSSASAVGLLGGGKEKASTLEKAQRVKSRKRALGAQIKRNLEGGMKAEARLKGLGDPALTKNRALQLDHEKIFKRMLKRNGGIPMKILSAALFYRTFLPYG